MSQQLRHAASPSLAARAGKQRAGLGNERARAARHLARVIGQATSLDALLAQESSSLCQALAYGSLRHYFSLSEAVNRRLSRPLKARDLDVHCLLLLGAYQLQHMRIPPHAAIDQTVTAAEALGKAWAQPLVNAVLRRLTETARTECAELPGWLAARLAREYPSEASRLEQALLAKAPMCLRVNRARIDPADYAACLDNAGIRYAKAWLPETLILEAPQPAKGLPGFVDGQVSVQDAGAQLVGDFACQHLKPGDRVLDACAAPGNKLFHMIESGLSLDLLALDASAPRLATLRSLASQLGHEAFDTLCANARSPDWWDGRPFDFILLDAPCSGVGTLRRRPDIKVIRKEAAVRRAAELQADLLAAVWRTLKPGGLLLYCTCSLLAEENDEVVTRFLHSEADASVQACALPSGHRTPLGWQLLPTDARTDGFYIALLGKRG